MKYKFLFVSMLAFAMVACNSKGNEPENTAIEQEEIVQPGEMMTLTVGSSQPNELAVPSRTISGMFNEKVINFYWEAEKTEEIRVCAVNSSDEIVECQKFKRTAIIGGTSATFQGVKPAGGDGIKYQIFAGPETFDSEQIKKQYPKHNYTYDAMQFESEQYNDLTNNMSIPISPKLSVLVLNTNVQMNATHDPTAEVTYAIDNLKFSKITLTQTIYENQEGTGNYEQITYEVYPQSPITFAQNLSVAVECFPVVVKPANWYTLSVQLQYENLESLKGTFTVTSKGSSSYKVGDVINLVMSSYVGTLNALSTKIIGGTSEDPFEQGQYNLIPGKGRSVTLPEMTISMGVSTSEN